MDGRGALYRAQQLQGEMSPEDFYQGLKEAAIEAFEQEQLPTVSEIIGIDQTITKDAEVKATAEKYFKNVKDKGYEENEQLKQLFGI